MGEEQDAAAASTPTGGSQPGEPASDGAPDASAGSASPGLTLDMLLRNTALGIDTTRDQASLNAPRRLATNLTTMEEMAACLREHASVIVDVCVRRYREAILATKIGATGSAYGDKGLWQAGAKVAHDNNWEAGVDQEERLAGTAGYLTGLDAEMRRVGATGEEARDQALARLERIHEERGPYYARRLSTDGGMG